MVTCRHALSGWGRAESLLSCFSAWDTPVATMLDAVFPHPCRMLIFLPAVGTLVPQFLHMACSTHLHSLGVHSLGVVVHQTQMMSPPAGQSTSNLH